MYVVLCELGLVSEPSEGAQAATGSDSVHEKLGEEPSPDALTVSGTVP